VIQSSYKELDSCIPPPSNLPSNSTSNQSMSNHQPNKPLNSILSVSTPSKALSISQNKLQFPSLPAAGNFHDLSNCIATKASNRTKSSGAVAREYFISSVGEKSLGFSSHTKKKLQLEIIFH
jgi:hypothetical protein